MCELAILAFAVYGLVDGKFSFSRTRVIYGWPARVASGILLLYFPTAIIGAISVGILQSVLNQGRPPTPGGADRFSTIFIVAYFLNLVFFVILAYSVAYYFSLNPEYRVNPKADKKQRVLEALDEPVEEIEPVAEDTFPPGRDRRGDERIR